MKYVVFHAINPSFGLVSLESKNPHIFPKDFEKVAEVEVDSADSLDTVDEIFRLTNHIEGPWWENSEVTWHKERSRSTSVGDVIVTETGIKYLCEGKGWKVI